MQTINLDDPRTTYLIGAALGVVAGWALHTLNARRLAPPPGPEAVYGNVPPLRRPCPCQQAKVTVAAPDVTAAAPPPDETA